MSLTIVLKVLHALIPMLFKFRFKSGCKGIGANVQFDRICELEARPFLLAIVTLHNQSNFSAIIPQDYIKATIAVSQTLSCKITDLLMTEPVHVTWKDNDSNEITDSTEGYTIDQGTVDNDNVQTSTLTISTAKLRAMETNVPLTWKCSAKSLHFPLSEHSADFNVIISKLRLTCYYNKCTVIPRYNAPRYKYNANADLAITRFFTPKVFLPHLLGKGKFSAKLVNISL